MATAHAIPFDVTATDGEVSHGGSDGRTSTAIRLPGCTKVLADLAGPGRVILVDLSHRVHGLRRNFSSGGRLQAPTARLGGNIVLDSPGRSDLQGHRTDPTGQVDDRGRECLEPRCLARQRRCTTAVAARCTDGAPSVGAAPIQGSIGGMCRSSRTSREAIARPPSERSRTHLECSPTGDKAPHERLRLAWHRCA